MTQPSIFPQWDLKRGAIYQDVYSKRVDERPVEVVASLVRARVEGDALTFASESQRHCALRDGIFLLYIPATIDLSAGDAFAGGFYQGSTSQPYGRFRSMTSEHFGDPLLGFHERSNQIEQFLLERRFWKRDYPIEIMDIGEQMVALAHTVLRSVLRLTDIPERDWPTATGGCSDAAGSYHLTFNHYRPALPGVGLASHKDDGFVTLLRTTAAGLEINRNENWESVVPDPAYFVVNFGLSMEVLTRESAQPVAAIMHRVRHQSSDRFSFGHFSSSFCEPDSDVGIYCFNTEAGLRRICSSRNLIDANDEEIYQGTQRRGESP
ncbi:2OG-Fe(II) oxygenase family protein [Janthinobacterium sp. PAMC25594]|uniref:2OG-Fe(II) oxygenase family protein n=1 Tax=Janthinobacterium sp. PAMC25594 TaxID=2861284 RepID=UPI001C626B17|nr:2OG-Fe(II) oxygenase family protein [Janthinobacterium sp. PAMC25594]QYG08888.1 hypothetical protein KY494_09155 [Janthinobacterium sp. PAMC25594]